MGILVNKVVHCKGERYNRIAISPEGIERPLTEKLDGCNRRYNTEAGDFVIQAKSNVSKGHQPVLVIYAVHETVPHLRELHTGKKAITEALWRLSLCQMEELAAG